MAGASLVVRKIELIESAAFDGRLSNLAVRVLINLTHHRNAVDGLSFPGPMTIAREVNSSERNVFRALSELLGAGYIKVGERGGGRSKPTGFSLPYLSGFTGKTMTPASEFTGETTPPAAEFKPETLPKNPLNPAKTGPETLPKLTAALKEEPVEENPVGNPREPTLADPIAGDAIAPSKRGPSTKRTSRGTRLPDDWTLPDEWRAWATKDRPDVDVQLEAAKFSDHFHSTTKNPTSLDWFARFRNWVRRAHTGNGTNGAAHHAGGRNLGDAAADMLGNTDRAEKARRAARMDFDE